MISPTQRTVNYLRKLGCQTAIVERWNAHVVRPDGGRGVRQDLWGFGDILAVEPDHPGALLVQCARTDDAATRIAKIKSPKVWEKARRWLAAGNRIHVMTWAVRGAQGERKRWTLRTINVGLEGEEELGKQ